jgi:hypothetical protein
MQVSLIYFEGCPHWQVASSRLAHAIDYAGVGQVAVELLPITTHEGALAVGMRGSPTILIDGTDPFAEPGLPAGMSCRMFATEHGTDGAPSVVQLIEALRCASWRQAGRTRHH